VTICLILLLSLSACESEPSAAPNVILISLDSLRADHVGCYGYDRETTPQLDQLAAKGAHFQNVVAETSWTLPAHATMFTGVPSAVHGVTADQRLGNEHPTLARVLSRHGYRTRGLWSGPYLHPVFRLDRGFSPGDYEGVIATSYDQLPTDLGAKQFSKLRDETNRDSHKGATSPRVVSRAIEFLEDPGPKPFFLFLHLFDIHYDFEPPEEIWRQFDADYEGDLEATNFLKNKRINRSMEASELDHVLALYDGEIFFTDQHLGRLFEAVDRLGLGDNTLIMVTADHGDEFFEHQKKGHRKTLFDEVIAVPLIAAGAGVTVTGAGLPDLVHHMDIMPTILEMLGIPCPEAVMGRSFAPLLKGHAMDRERLLPALLVRSPNERLASIRADAWKAVWDIGPDDSVFQIYDLEDDPGEQNPLQVPDNDPRRRLAEQAFDHYALGGQSADSEDESGQPDLPDALEQQLRELGYLK